MRYAVLIVALAALLGAPASRGAEPPADSHVQAATELLKLMNVEREMAVGADAMADALIQRTPALKPYKDVLLRWAATFMTWDTFGARLVALYTDAFSEAELRDIAAFYRSPAGQKALVVLPRMAHSLAEIGASIAQEHAPELDTMIRARAAELEKAGAKP